ncbi:MAG TPA: UbiD family decarboxylase, partial [Acidimicrobiia bacterium]|nr:UbiD family decarboxylase [Acidimicrobiia bacterium]
MSTGITTSLGEWLEHHAAATGVLTVEDMVDPGAYEATAILHQLETPSGGPPVLFANLRNLTGERSPARMLFNTYSKRRSVGLALGIEAEGWNDLLEALPQISANPQVPVETTEAPVQATVIEGDDLDLRILPWTKHVEMEGGLYFTPILAAKKPGSDRYNLSWNRVMFLDPTHAGVHISPRQLWSFQREAEQTGEDLPVAMVLGHHPAFNLAAAALTAMDIDEYNVAGALMGHPLQVSPSVRFGEDLMIPAGAEMIIEGRLIAAHRVVEGPFGEYMRYLGPQKLSHLFEADAITFRPDPIILEIFAGHREHLNAHVSIHASLLAAARTAVPQVTRVGWFQGGGPTTAVVALDKSADGQPMRAAMAILAAGNLIKQVIVVDDDIDVFDAQTVMWAISTR